MLQRDDYKQQNKTKAIQTVETRCIDQEHMTGENTWLGSTGKSCCAYQSDHCCCFWGASHPSSMQGPSWGRIYLDNWTVCWLLACLLNVSATCKCISGMDLLRQLYILPHWDRSCRSNILSHPVTVYWHRTNQSQCWPCNEESPLEYQFLSHWYDSTWKNSHGVGRNLTQVCCCWGGRLNHEANEAVQLFRLPHWARNCRPNLLSTLSVQPPD